MNKKLLILSLPCILGLVGTSAYGAIRIGNNSSRGGNAEAYYQNSLQQQAAYNSVQQQTADTNALPVPVADGALAEQIRTGNSLTGVNDLEACSMIYPGGKFEWDRPTGGGKFTGPETCVSVVELRMVNGSDDIILARAKVAAGDAMDCNISNFPQATYMPAAGEVTFPPDRAPTIEDVKEMMDAEQKKGAGFKIAAGAIVGALGGNAAGKNDVGSVSTFGTDKGKMQGAAIGALSGAALMAGSSYSGKVGGDMIMSAGVNAMAGGVVGNMMASGESVLDIKDCKDLHGIETTCLWGVIEKHTPLAGKKAFYNIENDKTVVCEDGLKKCTSQRLIAITFDDYKNVEEAINDQRFLKSKNNSDIHYTFKDGKDMEPGYSGDSNGLWIPIKSAGVPGQRVAAMVTDFKEKTFGSKLKDWNKWKSNFGPVAKQQLVGRDNKGNALELPKNKNGNDDWDISDFYPLTVSASDGGVIDISNKARIGGTLTGAGVGAGLGAFTAYQGATDEIERRWVSSITEYKDSLQKFYCATGTRFLSTYNDTVVIPNYK